MLTNRTQPVAVNDRVKARDRGMGGFPGFFTIIQALARRIIPHAVDKLDRKFTIPPTTTLVSNREQGHSVLNPFMRFAPWLTFDELRVGRNSDFNTDDLTDEKLEEIGGIEYRALRVLGYLVSAVSFPVLRPGSLRLKKVSSISLGHKL